MLASFGARQQFLFRRRRMDNGLARPSGLVVNRALRVNRLACPHLPRAMAVKFTIFGKGVSLPTGIELMNMRRWESSLQVCTSRCGNLRIHMRPTTGWTLSAVASPDCLESCESIIRQCKHWPQDASGPISPHAQTVTKNFCQAEFSLWQAE